MSKNIGKTIIIGGGISGILSAIYLARAGKDVTLLEQNHHLGGNMSGFNRKGYYFDGGDQSFESLGIVFPILKELELYNKFKWNKVKYRFKSNDFDFHVDSIDQVERSLKEAFPSEAGLSYVFSQIREVSDFMDVNCSAYNCPILNNFSIKELLKLVPKYPKIRKWLTFKYREEVCSVIKDVNLRNWLTGIGYYRMPFLFFAGFWNLWTKDYWYPVGGMQNFFDVLVSHFKDLGGSIKCNYQVKDINIKNKKVIGITSTKNEFIPCDSVIYSGDYKAIFNMLPQGLIGEKEVVSTKDQKLTESLVAVYLGLKITPKELLEKVGANHVFWFPNYDVIFPDKDSPRDIHGKMWITSNCYGEENSSFSPDGKATLVLQTYSSAEWQNYWDNGSLDFKRSNEYLETKKMVADQMVKLAENILPGITNMIDYLEVGSPLSSHRYTLNDLGSSGGWCYDDKISKVYKKTFKNLIKTPVKNLLVAGHYSVWPGGVISAALSARLATNMLLGRRILSRIK